MNINRATRQYEIWLGEHLTLVPDDLTDKHTKMAAAVFPFLRATFYRWAQERPRVCAALAKAPAGWQLATCMSKISARGVTVRGG